MKIDVRHNIPDVQRWLSQVQGDSRRALREGLNRTTDRAHDAVVAEMDREFDRPTPLTRKSLFRRYANTQNLTSILWFKQRRSERDKQWAVPQIEGGSREMKPMELRLQRANILPKGWHVVPGGAMPLDAFGNINRGEVSRILNVLGTYTEAGYNKANQKTRERLAKGNKKAYGFVYWVNPVPGRPGHQKHLLPGVYRRVQTPFGSSLKPMLIFVQRANYSARLQFRRVVDATVQQHFAAEYDKAMQSLLQTGSASGARAAAGGFQPRKASLWG